MSITIEASQAAALLRDANDILILCHKKPDGDTFGSGFALLRALWSLGKRAAIACSDGFSAHYDFLYPDFSPADTLAKLGEKSTAKMDGTEQVKSISDSPLSPHPAFIVAVDVADLQLLGEGTRAYGERADLCIDHHPSNTGYAKQLFVDVDAAATCELIYDVIKRLGVTLTADMATALYTGLCTDTGCFRYANTTARTLRIAADLYDAGARGFMVSKRLMETKSHGRLEMERLVLQTLEYYFDGRTAVLVISKADVAQAGVLDDELEGLSAMPRQIEGVEVGITFKEVGESLYRVSLRTGDLADASTICRKFGGGGHKRAGGCEMQGTLAVVKQTMLDEVAHILNAQ